MAITRYDTPAEMQVMDTYVPIPFEALAQAGLHKRKLYEESKADEEAALESYAGVKALDKVYIPGKGYVDVGDAKAVKDRTAKLQDKVYNLVNSGQDKASPLYRSQLANILRETRLEFAPDGVIGRAMQNYSAYGELNKRMRENEDLQSSPYLALGAANELEQYAASSKDGVGYLAGQASIGKDPKITERLTAALSHIKGNVSSSIQEDLDNGIIRKEDVESVTAQRVAQATADLIESMPDVKEALNNQVAWNNRAGGSDTYEDSVYRLAGSMSNIFSYSKSKKDLDLNSGWATMKKEESASPIEVPTVQKVQGTNINDYQGLKAKLAEAVKNVENIDSTIAKYKQALQKSPTMLDPTGRTNSQVSIQSEIDKLEGEKKALQSNYKTLEEFKELALTRVGLDSGAIEKQYGKKAVDEAKAKAAAMPEEQKVALLEMLGIDSSIKIPKGELDYLAFLPGAVSSRAEKFKQLDKELKEISENYVHSSNAVMLSKEHMSQIDSENYKAALLAGGNLKWADIQHQAGEQVDPAKVKPKNMKAIGADKDPLSGARVSKYIVTDDDGAVIGTLSAPMSELQEGRYIQEGKLEAPNEGYEGFTNYMKSKLSGITGEGTIKTSDSPDAKTVQIVKPQREGEKYYMRFETGEKDANGNPVYGRDWPAKSESDMYEKLWGALHYNN